MKNTAAISYTAALLVMLFLINSAYLEIQRASMALFGLAIAAVVVVAVSAACAWIRPSPPSSNDPSTKPDRLNFVWIIVFEGAAMGAGNSLILRHHYDDSWMVVWSTAVVAVHFFMMGWAKRYPLYHAIGLIVLLGAAVGMVDGRDNLRAAIPLTVLFLTLAASIVGATVRRQRPKKLETRG